MANNCCTHMGYDPLTRIDGMPYAGATSQFSD
jgi:hypothetical protein